MVSVDLRPGERNGGVAVVLRGELEVVAALGSAGPIERRQLAGLVQAGLYGPGRFPRALRQAITQSKVRRTGKGLYALARGRVLPQALEGPRMYQQAGPAFPAAAVPG